MLKEKTHKDEPCEEEKYLWINLRVRGEHLHLIFMFSKLDDKTIKFHFYRCCT